MLFLNLKMINQSLHIISFDNPFPPGYGGVIDVFYKIKALHSIGVEVHLHCFVDEVPADYSVLKEHTAAVFFYVRKNKFWSYFQVKPFSVHSRFSKEMINRLYQDNFPILFEGLQTTSMLKHFNNKSRKLFLRLHNNEEKYYSGISKSEKNIFKKGIYWLESKKYKHFQKSVFNQFEKVFTLSETENNEINLFSKNSVYVPVFHGNNNMKSFSKKGEIALYHGDLRISDNKKAVDFLILVFKELPEYKFIIASKSGRREVENKTKNTVNISFVETKDHVVLNELFEQTHLHVLFSFQQSGTKLKVINSLFNGRFCLINSNMVDDKQIQNLCSLAETKEEFKSKIIELMQKSYNQDENRTKVLTKVLNDIENAKIIANSIFKY